MNAKKAKLMRKYGKVDRKTKKMYNSLTHHERGILKDAYQYNIERKKTIKPL